jgi:hypothetical protein
MSEGGALAALMLQGAEAALAEGALLVLEEAKRRAPKTDPQHDPDPSTTLADSGRIEVHGRRVVEIVFDTPYAAKQHEALHYEHRHGGEAKFLEHALVEIVPRLERIVAAEVHKRMKSGAR